MFKVTVYEKIVAVLEIQSLRWDYGDQSLISKKAT